MTRFGDGLEERMLGNYKKNGVMSSSGDFNDIS